MLIDLKTVRLKEKNAMRNVIAAFITTSFLVLTGCIPSLHPIYTAGDIIFDEAILGAWEDIETGESWTFSNVGKSEYKLTYKDDSGRKGDFSARLVKISGHLFLDIVPADPGFVQNKFFQDHFLKTHSFVHVLQTQPTAKFAALEPRWLNDLLTERPTAIRHERIGGEILLTSSTRDTQKFLVDNLTTRGAYSEPINLTRKKNPRK
jgi:hypothetical protein